MEKLKILHMYPNMLDLYGDSGNVEVLSYRCKMRGIELEVSKHLIGDKETDFTQYDIIYLGGGADFEQQILADDLVSCKDSIMEAYKAGTFFLMICRTNCWPSATVPTGSFFLMKPLFTFTVFLTVHHLNIRLQRRPAVFRPRQSSRNVRCIISSLNCLYSVKQC